MARRVNYTQLIARGWFSITLFAILGLILALVISFLQPLRYSSTVRLLVLQDVGTAVDAYTASRSEERIAEKLATIIHTTTFFQQVLHSGFSIDERIFPIEDAKRRRAWEKTVSATVQRGTGIMSISAFHEDPRQAEQIALAVSTVLTERVGEYTSERNVSVRLVDAPLQSNWPVKPNILANGFSGLFLGGLAGVAFVFAQAERIRRRHQLVHEEY